MPSLANIQLSPKESCAKEAASTQPGIQLNSAFKVCGGAFAKHRMAMKLFRDVARAGLQSASIMTAADLSTQLIVEKKRLKSGEAIDGGMEASKPRPVATYDPVRTLHWATVGLTLHGPYFFFSFSRVDSLFGAATALRIVAKKTAFAQFVVFPPYLMALFWYVGVMEGSDDVVGKVCDRAPEAFVGGCLYWPVANYVNFSFVPSSARVLYIAAIGGLWNGYLSYMNARKIDGDTE